MSPILIVLILIASFEYQTNAECCGSAILVDLRVRICPDGSVMGFYDKYCGVGRCNMFGCHCDGGCKHNSKGDSREEAIRLYREKHKQ